MACLKARQASLYPVKLRNGCSAVRDLDLDEVTMLLADVGCGVLAVNRSGGPNGGPLVIRKSTGMVAIAPSRWVVMFNDSDHFTMLVKKVLTGKVEKATGILTTMEVERIITHHTPSPHEVETFMEPSQLMKAARLYEECESGGSFYDGELRYWTVLSRSGAVVLATPMTVDASEVETLACVDFQEAVAKFDESSFMTLWKQSVEASSEASKAVLAGTTEWSVQPGEERPAKRSRRSVNEDGMPPSWCADKSGTPACNTTKP